MYRAVVIGGGWSGIAAALGAKKAGAEVTLLEKTDMNNEKQRQIYGGRGKHRFGSR